NAAEGLAFATRHSLRFFEDYRDLVQANDVEAVVVVTPPSLAAPICLEAVRVGKPLLVEKPLACTGAEAREMVRAAESCGVPLMTAQTLRYDAAVLAAKARLVDVGLPQYLVLTCRVEPNPDAPSPSHDYGGRGVLLEIGIHLLDLIRFLTGDEIGEVRCELERPLPGQPESRAFVSLRTSRRLPCLVDVSRVGSGRTGRIEWIGSDGQVTGDWLDHRVRRLSRHQAVEEWICHDQPTIVTTLSAFVGALRSGTPVPISGRDGLRAVEIADACYESAEIGRWVSLLC
ncbi:MAG TPA: Gfo/Idh/MocA family oxidoreductase, partial [Nitrospiraceae bacterium]|nr:Gfo/Idh/MocA family oxidoreductase [Nitrospiraceae bacterium]